MEKEIVENVISIKTDSEPDFNFDEMVILNPDLCAELDTPCDGDGTYGCGCD